ncbi:MAG TPA: bifunctional DNA-binding transcriptional regulator/O6-methylguanine-DNA methyltransferase Ada [Verrucomicrobiales bacterium]|nr:bifunctional DNA-binding transcriptional regulator/O6-methylguanine-DNA methyltransferase Ada [Verrucomicrobiales bacterium]
MSSSSRSQLTPPSSALPPWIDEERWITVQRREPGAFVYAVRTTGVFCRPGCPSRLPRREHVRFFDHCDAAAKAGFRPCKRCQPDGPGLAALHAETVARACRILQRAEPPPKLLELAQAVGMSPYHLHRIFTGITGLTPKAYAAAHRAERLRRILPGACSVTEAIYEAGYTSSGRFYADSSKQLGMQPGISRQYGRDELIRFSIGACALGVALVAASDKGVCAVFLGDDARSLEEELQRRFQKARRLRAGPEFDRIVSAVLRLVEEPGSDPNLPLDLRGTAFQQKVWQALQRIPAGNTVSYAEIACKIGKPGSARAVAGACAANSLALLVPCHRVVHQEGSLSGYRWGVNRKQALLDRERRDAGRPQ